MIHNGYWLQQWLALMVNGWLMMPGSETEWLVMMVMVMMQLSLFIMVIALVDDWLMMLDH